MITLLPVDDSMVTLRKDTRYDTGLLISIPDDFRISIEILYDANKKGPASIIRRRSDQRFIF